MNSTLLQDRITGALMGAFIGDALALGPHWYYDLNEMHANYGPWISDYSEPKPGRYHAGMKSGQSSQAGLLLALTLRSLVDQGVYDEAHRPSREHGEAPQGHGRCFRRILAKNQKTRG